MKSPKLLALLLPLIVGVFSSAANAMSVSWQGSTAIMTYNQSFLNDWVVAYSFKNDMAIAARYSRSLMKDGSELRQYAPQFNLLVHRWNAPDFQANIYADGAFGAMSFQGQTSTTGIGTLEADIESRELYAAGKTQANWVGIGSNFYGTELRLGAAPYKADFDEIASWFIVSFQDNPQLLKAIEVTPLVRLFYKSVLIEVGSSFQGDWMFNSMIHF